MAGTHGIDIEAFHQHQIFDHRLDSDRVTTHRIVLMAIDAAEVNWCTVDQYFSIFDLHRSEAHLALLHLEELAAVIPELDQQSVQVWMFTVPFFGVGDLSCEL